MSGDADESPQDLDISSWLHMYQNVHTSREIQDKTYTF
jgi:hypothetical protein